MQATFATSSNRGFYGDKPPAASRFSSSSSGSSSTGTGGALSILNGSKGFKFSVDETMAIISEQKKYDNSNAGAGKKGKKSKGFGEKSNEQDFMLHF